MAKQLLTADQLRQKPIASYGAERFLGRWQDDFAQSCIEQSTGTEGRGDRQ